MLLRLLDLGFHRSGVCCCMVRQGAQKLPLQRLQLMLPKLLSFL
uniref:Uncharacterized protein n=1 Tax=Arundo donax TaxID=35708 RepID=A0A0A9CXU4_ARUDO